MHAGHPFLSSSKKSTAFKEAVKLSKEWIERTLINLGFTEKDTQVYLFLAAKGPKKAKDIAEALNLYNSQLYRILKRLQNNGAVNASSDYPARYSAVIFEKVLELIVEAKREQHKALLASKAELLSTWRSITRNDDVKS
jgi:sugar-specific transcriptional regulator TrmB